MRSLVIAALLCLGFGLVTAAPASAHDQLISSNPTPEERLGVAPSSVKLSFSAPLLTLGYEIRIVDAGSKNWARGTATLDRDSLSQPVVADLPEGEYQVRWRVVSSDGHPINGAYSFLVGAKAQQGSIPNVTGQEPAATTAAASGVAGPAASAFPAWGIPALFGAGAGLVLYLAYLALSSVRRHIRADQD
ncbi:copper resistance CopC family protein [Arthrobacter sp. TMN-49]